MRALFFVVSLIILVVVCLCCYILRQRGTAFKKSLFYLNFATSITIALQLLSLMNFNMKLSLFLNGLYYASVDWLISYIFDYIYVFTEMSVKPKARLSFKRIFSILFLIDAAFLLTNVFTGFSFEITPFFFNRKFFCWNFYFHFAFYFHIAICYFLILLCLYELVKKIVTTNKFYRQKYKVIFSIFMLGFFVNAYLLFTKDTLDISLLLYGIFSAFATYYSFYSAPKSVEAKILNLVTDNINNGVLCFDLNKKCIYANKIGIKFFPDKKSAEEELEDLILTGKESLSREINIFKNRQKFVLSEEFYVIRDSNQLLLGYSIFFEDVTNELNLLEKERFLSSHDSLTGLFKRSNFFLLAEKLLKKEPEVPRYFVCTDIMNFKIVNDLFGSALGDEILKKEADILKKLSEEDALTGRISNDRFAVVVRKDKFKPLLVEKQFEEISRFLSKYNYKIHFRIGVYEISDPYENVNSMYDKAELAVRENDVLERTLSFYSASMMNNLIEEKKVVTSFDQALAENQFAMYLQPQVSSINEKVAGAEALVRWISPEKGVLGPNSFVPILEKAGLLFRLDLFIWQEAARKLSEWKKRGIDMYIAVNISAKDFYHLDLYKIFTELVEKYGIEPGKLKLEITETVFMHNIKLHTQVLSKLQNYGFFIEMDDFGSGYSSLNMLKNLTVDILKIDMFFLSQPKNSEKSKLILSKIIKMAKKLGLVVISEGVESEVNAEFLRNAGCDFFQGYLFSKPVPVSVFERNFISSDFNSALNAGENI